MERYQEENLLRTVRLMRDDFMRNNARVKKQVKVLAISLFLFILLILLLKLLR